MPDSETLRRGWELARVCRAVYAGPIRHGIYSYRGGSFSNQKIIHGSFGRGYCRVFWNHESAVIAFRGTRERVDWSVSNLKALPVPLRDCPDATSVYVHRGFQRTLDYGDKTSKRRSIDAIFKCLEDFGLLRRSIAITGHSLGGALAILFAAKFRSRYGHILRECLREIMTFGSPAAGLKSFKVYFGELEKITTRFINNSDAVPYTPPLLYRHVGREIWLQKCGPKTDVGWSRRLRYAIGGQLARLSLDHNIEEYICQLQRHVQDPI